MNYVPFVSFPVRFIQSSKALTLISRAVNDVVRMDVSKNSIHVCVTHICPGFSPKD